MRTWPQHTGGPNRLGVVSVVEGRSSEMYQYQFIFAAQAMEAIGTHAVGLADHFKKDASRPVETI